MGNVKEKLKNREKILGMMLKLVDEPDIVQLIKLSGFDFFIADNEHGFFSYKKLKDLMLYAKALGICSLIRIPEISRDVVLKCMDLGSGGLMAPNVETVEEARRLVEYAKYAPMGDRGVNPVAAHSQYNPGNLINYMKRANEETILFAMLESQKGLNNLTEILMVDGIDAVLVGPVDFTQSSGFLGKYDSSEFENDMKKTIEIAKKTEKAAGISFGDPDAIIKWLDNGMQIGLLGNEIAFMLKAAKADVKKVKEHI